MRKANPKARSGSKIDQRSYCVILFLLLATASGLHSQTISASSLQQLPQTGSTAGAAAAGGSNASTGRSGPTLAPEDISKVRLAPGSTIDLHVFEESDLDGTYTLDDHGNISLPLAGTIHLDSLSLRQAEAAISEKLVSSQILNAPHVVVNLNQYSARNIVVLGEVSAPGRYPVLGTRNLMDVLAIAGGQTALAGNEIVIHRLGQPIDVTETVHYGRDVNDPTALHVPINPGDTVLVKRAGIVYVLGAVNRPGGYVMQEAGDLNVAQALALALGTAPEAKVGSIRVIRKLPDRTLMEVGVDYKKISKGEAIPFPLMAEDIVYVPPSAVKSVLIRGAGIVSAATSATIYTSTR